MLSTIWANFCSCLWFITVLIIKSQQVNKKSQFESKKKTDFTNKCEEAFDVVLLTVLYTFKPSKDLWRTAGLSEWRDPVCHWKPFWRTTSRVAVCRGQRHSNPLLRLFTHTHTGFIRVINTSLNNRALCRPEGYLEILWFIFSDAIWWAFKPLF